MFDHGLVVKLQRRQFLKILLIAGGLAGCRGLIGNETSEPTPVIPPVLSPVPALRFILEDDAVSYEPHPAGCERTTIRGSVRDITGVGLSGVTIRLWQDDPNAAAALLTDGQGSYETDVDAGLSEQTYHLQIVDQATGAQRSDVIVVTALPSCEHNLMTVNFIAVEG